VPVAVDDNGIDVAAGMRLAPHARVVYVTPAHQYPLGMAMHMSRRLELLHWARDAGAWIIEDDYDSEFRFEGRPLSALQGLDGAGRVVHIGSLSKMLFPGLRLGYVVLPPALVEPFARARHLADRFPASIAHEIVTGFILDGSFTAHIRRTRALYARSRDTLAALARKHLADAGTIAVADRGMHLLLHLRPGLDDGRAAEAAARAGVAAKPLSPMYVGHPPRHGLLLGFTGFTRTAIDDGVRRLAQALHGL
jgi:GntR family transcriptional regulator/MocR family aminotransferase